MMDQVIYEPPNYGSPLIDDVAKIYISVFTAWTAVFVTGLAVFLKHRDLPFIRVKNVPLVCSALLMLHLELSFDILQYPLNGTLPCNLEFWIMNICLPLGIALFQAQNMQLLCLFWGQTHLIWLRSSTQPQHRESENLPRNRLMQSWRNWSDMCVLSKTYTIIAIGTGFQILCGLFIFLASRRFHPSFGILSTPVGPFQCRMGWEWFPSGIWQAVWTYGFGPIILYRIRKIQDTHRWRLQTTLAILFSLPALPLWMSTFFMPDFYVTNWYWTPTLWFVPGLAAMEFIILFFPIVEIYKFKNRQRKAREEPERSKYSKYSQYSKYSLEALEDALRDDIGRLEEFAATKDFTGENILFLKRVENWKERWNLLRMEHINSMSKGQANVLPPLVLRSLYETAEEIFQTLIHRETSYYPLNLDDDVYLCLDRVFRSAPALSPFSSLATITSNSKAMIAPFADDTQNRHGSHEIGDKPVHYHERSPTPQMRKYSIPLMPLSQEYKSPEGFGITVFDRAEVAIKQIVLTNTWIRYVDSLPPHERALIGLDSQISPPIGKRWTHYFWKQDSS